MREYVFLAAIVYICTSVYSRHVIDKWLGSEIWLYLLWLATLEGLYFMLRSPRDARKLQSSSSASPRSNIGAKVRGLRKRRDTDPLAWKRRICICIIVCSFQLSLIGEKEKQREIEGWKIFVLSSSTISGSS